MALRYIVIAIFGLVVGGLFALSLGGLGPPNSSTVVGGKALVGGPFRLTDHNGAAFTERDLLGRHALVFFGFTHCPDICPSGLQTMAAALDQLGDKSEQVVPVFITLDPERDTAPVLAQYVKSFHPRLIGLTGSRAESEAAAKAYRVWAKRVDDGETGTYSFDHSSIIYWIDPQGAFVAPFGHGTRADQIADRLRAAL
jgi:protein SCO1/2